MGIGHAGGAGLANGSTRHEPHEVECGPLLAPPPATVALLPLRQALLQVLVDDEVDHGLTDAPPGGGEALPEALHSALSMDSPYHGGQAGVAAV